MEGRVKRGEKAAVVDELRTLLAGAKAAMLADHRGLTVSELTELRKLLREQSVVLRVVKNTLARMATRGTELEGLGPHLVGPTAIALGKGDPALPAKLLASYARTKPILQIKAGFVEGTVLAKQDALALAELPPREVLLARLAGLTQSPLRGLVLALRGPLHSLAMVLAAVRQKREQEAPRP
jgi:large subunit ribosomal protein L10